MPKHTSLVNRIYTKGEDLTRESLIQKIEDNLSYDRIQLGKRKTNGNDHFYVFITDHNNKQWKIKLTTSKLAEPRPFRSSVQMDLEHKFDTVLMADHQVYVETFAPYTHEQWMYHHANKSIEFSIDILNQLSALFHHAIDDAGQTFVCGHLLELEYKA